MLRTILADAVQRRLIEHNSCHIRGAGKTKRVKEVEPASLPELAALTKAMCHRLPDVLAVLDHNGYSVRIRESA